MTTINIKEYLKNRSSYMHLLIVLFGISAWIGVNGIFVQLPILIHCSPEGSALPTYIVIAIQMVILMSFLCFFGNGFLPSIQSYSSLPYGNITYQLSITLAQFANPIACFITFWIIPSNLNIIHSLSTIILILCSYVTYVALMSPFVPLQESKIGVIIILISWTILIGLISYVKLIIISIFRQVQKENILFYVGIIMQGGSASGAIISFTLINFTDLFHT